MKKDRNCGNYPIYPSYGGMMPGPMPITGVEMPMPLPMASPSYTTGYSSYANSDLTSINNRLNSLEQRVNSLENMYSSNYSNSYNSSNYQMM